MRIFTYTNSVGQEIEMVEIENGEGGATQMTKALWDELEAQREQSGTLTNQGGN